MNMIDAPVIILVHPQLAENIGTAARAMYNGGLTRLRLVSPKGGWPNPDAIKPAAGAHRVLEDVEVFDSTAEAIKDLNVIFAATARRRDMLKPVVTPKAAAQNFHDLMRQENKVGVLFGPERTGLDNDDLSRVDTIINVPLNPEYTSLNLAQAVLIIAYEWIQASDQASSFASEKTVAVAPKAELLDLFEHLESELDRSGFLRVPHKRPAMVRNIRNMLLRADLTSQEVSTLRGVIASLVDPYFKRV